jgi:hypothetical protein
MVMFDKVLAIAATGSLSYFLTTVSTISAPVLVASVSAMMGVVYCSGMYHGLNT